MPTDILVPQAETSISTNPHRLMEIALEHGAGIDVMERLAKLQCDMLDRQAKLEFNDAMQRAQAKMRRIGTDAVNPQTHSKYATYAKLDAALRPIYSDEGFALSFNTADPPQPDMVRVTCDVSRGGHVKTYQIDMPADGKGAKGNDVMTKTHATGSATMYGRRYLLNMIFNTAIGETDDDGNGGDMNETEYVSVLDNISGASDEAELKRIYMAGYKIASEAKDRTAMLGIVAAKDKRKAELGASK